MSELVLVRHGETAWNAVRRLQGHIDTPLNEEGERQAQALAASLANSGASRVFASDLSRARNTAMPVAQALGLPLQVEPLLRERCFGAFEGLQYEEIERHFPEAFIQWQARDLHARYPAGERAAETLAELAERVGTVLQSLATSAPGETIIAVTHGGFLDCAYRLATGMDLRAPRNFDVKNASINRFAWHADRGLQLLEWGQVRHLGLSLDEPIR